MTDQDSDIGLSSTVSQVVDQFVVRMRADDGIESHAIDRLEKLLRKPVVPKPDDINATLFGTAPDGAG